MLLDADDAQLVLMDYQTRLMPALFESAAALANAQRLAQAATLLRIPVWGTEQSPAKLGPMLPELRTHCARVLAKEHFNAVADGLMDWLQPPERAPRQGNPMAGNARSLPKHLQKPAPAPEPTRTSLVLAGCETHVCLMQTALALLQEEAEVWIVTDACTSRSERNRDAAFDRLAGEGATLVTTEMVLFEWLGSAEHPQFKPVLELIRPQ